METVVSDNGREFIGRALDTWAHQRGMKLRFIRPGKPIENAYIESFNGKLRTSSIIDRRPPRPHGQQQRVPSAWVRPVPVLEQPPKNCGELLSSPQP